jgi:hypothetical protein
MHLSARLVTGVFVVLTITVLYTITSISSRDPTSVFFNPQKGYAPKYSTLRRQQAETFIKAHDRAHPGSVTKANNDVMKKKLCVGVPSVKRKGKDHLAGTVGSLLADLTIEERQEIHLVVFTPHTDPSFHPAYTQNWLRALADEVLTYDFGPDRMQYIRNMEQSDGHWEEKRMLDYAYLLSKCEETFIPYVAIIEDDTIAMDGWYHRTMAALREAEQQVALHHARTDFLHLRLFYTEEYLGWNAEYWPSYLWDSIFVAGILTALLVVLRLHNYRSKFTSCRAFLLLYPTLAILILFFFALGRNTVHPMPAGVHAMPEFGCCNQALVYPNHKIRELIVYLRDRRTGDLHDVLEDYANENKELRYAVTPSLVQHIGREGAKGRAEKVWSAAFERFGIKRLRCEHEKVAKLGVE